MRFVLLLAVCTAFAGCCGAGASTQSTSTGYSASMPAAMNAAVEPTGCTFQTGMQCGGSELFGARIDLPDLRPLFRFLVPSAPFTAPQAAPSASSASPCDFAMPSATYQSCGSGSCSDGFCDVPDYGYAPAVLP